MLCFIVGVFVGAIAGVLLMALVSAGNVKDRGNMNDSSYGASP